MNTSLNIVSCGSWLALLLRHSAVPPCCSKNGAASCAFFLSSQLCSNFCSACGLSTLNFLIFPFQLAHWLTSKVIRPNWVSFQVTTVVLFHLFVFSLKTLLLPSLHMILHSLSLLSGKPACFVAVTLSGVLSLNRRGCRELQIRTRLNNIE